MTDSPHNHDGRRTSSRRPGDNRSPGSNSPSGSPTSEQPEQPFGESSPLLVASQPSSRSSSPYHAGSEGDVADEMQVTRSVWYMILLTISIGGLQIAWSVELSNGSPYLLSLGLSKSLMALVWIAGPITGTIVQPYVGMLSDNCRLSMGKRKPFMLGGAAATMVSMMCLAWTRELVSGSLTLLGADPDSDFVHNAVIVSAVIWIYILDCAINTVQAAIRSFILDCAPAHQQESASAMASRITGFGNIIGYTTGYANLPQYLGFLGHKQFQILCALASVALGSTVCLSAATIKERDPSREPPSSKNSLGVVGFCSSIYNSIQRLPIQVRRVCQVQFYCWIGFFPFLFYTSSYIGDIYVDPYLQENPHMTPEELDALYEQATRVGTFALLVNSIVSLSTNVLLPFFIDPTYDSQPVLGDSSHSTASRSKSESQAGHTWFDRLQIPGLTLKRAWFGSLILFTVTMLCTLIVRSIVVATMLIGVIGITWAMTMWAPWAIISAEISRRDALMRAGRRVRTNRRSSLSSSSDGPRLASSEEVDQAGVILGIHNMSIAAPQIIATVGSSIIFKFWQKPRGTPGDHSIAIVFALGGLCVLIGASYALRIEDKTSMNIATRGDEEDVRPYEAVPLRTADDEGSAVES